MSEKDPMDLFVDGRPSGDPELEKIAAALHRGTSPEPSADLLLTTQERAQLELRRQGSHATASPLRLALAIAFPTVLCLGVHAFLLGVAAPWLATWMPGPIAWLVVGGYVLASAAWFALFWLALPALAHAHRKFATPGSALAVRHASGPGAN